MVYPSSFLSRLIREPLVHFLVLGASLFLLYASVGDSSPDTAGRIVVDEAEVRRLAEQFRRTWMRPPTRQELEGLAEDFVREEVLYREALALGLDRDDLVIRRRMRQKMEFLNTDLVEQRTPGEAELQAYLEANPDRFRQPARFGFQQIYLSREQGEDRAAHQAGVLLALLHRQPETAWQDLGDPTLLPGALTDASIREIAATYGDALAARIAATPAGGWSGPYASEYGLHLVRVTDRMPANLPALQEIRLQVEREWASERRQQANEQFYQALRKRYSVEIRLPDAADRMTGRQP
jgi:hypothetical protein